MSVIFCWMKISIFFLLEKNVSNLFEHKCQYIPLDQNVNKLSLLDENVSNFLLD